MFSEHELEDAQIQITLITKRGKVRNAKNSNAKKIYSNARKKKFLVIELKIHLCMKICSLGNTFLQFQEALGSLTMI